MAKKTAARPRARGWDLPPNALAAALWDFLEHSRLVNISPRTLRQRSRAVRRFILWAQERGISKPTELNLPVLERYQRHLMHYRKRDGAALSVASQITELTPVRSFCKWMTRARLTLFNPAAEMAMPRLPPAIPRYLLSIAQIETVLNQADVNTPMGVRDRALMEVLYSSAIRRMELCHLQRYDVDTQVGALRVREGKGGKDRIVPLGERACAWLQKYVEDVRPEWLIGEEHGYLFITAYGDPITDETAGDIVKRYLRAAGIEVRGSCHLFRHACATHMLDNGADTRFIQALLGHEDLASTQVYTRVSLARLKAIHNATHPARLERSKDAQRTTDEANHQPDALSARSALLAALDAEGKADADETDAASDDEAQAEALADVPSKTDAA